MKEPTGNLRAVPDSRSSAEESAEVFAQGEAEAPPRVEERRSWPVVLVVAGLSVGLLAAGLGWVAAHQRGQELEAKLQAATGHLETARAELSATQLALEARRAHYSRVREGVGALSVELQALTDLLSEDPEVTP